MTAMLANRSKARPGLNRYPSSPDSPLVPDMIIPSLYLTDLFTARGVCQPSYPSPSRPKIKYILSCLDSSISQPKPKPVNQDKLVQKLIIMDDTPDTDLLVELKGAVTWIDQCMASADGGVLVHCKLGQSRSASIVIAYIMWKQNLDFQTALDNVKRRRSMIRPNPGFQKQLQLWAEMQYDVMEADPEREGEMRKKETYVLWREEQRKKIQSMLVY